MARSRGKNRNNRNSDRKFVITGAVIIAVLILILVLINVFKSSGTGSNEAAEPSTDALISDEVIQFPARIDLSEVLPDGGIISVEGMTPAEISSKIASLYSWSMSVVNASADVGAEVIETVDASATTEAATFGSEDNPDGINSSDESEPEKLIVSDSVNVPDLVALSVPDLVNRISLDNEAYLDELSKKEAETEPSSETKKSLFKKETEVETTEEETAAPTVYKLSLSDTDTIVADTVSLCEKLWYVEPTGGSIGSYDASSDTFLMETAKSGFRVDSDELTKLISDAINGMNYSEEIQVPGTRLSAESNITVGDYQVLASYTTKTTSNSVRNKNILLACEAVNGTIVRPGEEFSFNNTVGQRTEAKGYGEAAAYNNGEVVQEIGGGVCQVSTTLYNAALKAGLKITQRQSHTFEPTYVTPGLDATISWGDPDFKFANLAANSEYSYSENYAIGIRASYSNQTVTVSIYGRPVLKPGYTYSLSSVKTKELDLVRELITPDSDKTPTTGTKGSVWETRLVVKKDGETISNNIDHMAYYTGHTEYYYEQAETEPVPESETETETSEIISDTPLGPGGSSISPGVIFSPGIILGPGTVETGAVETETETEAVIEEADSPGGPGSDTVDEGVYVSQNGPGGI